MTHLTDIIARRWAGFYIATVMACGSLTFYSLPDAWPFVVRLTTMVAMQVAVGKVLQRETRTHGK